MTDPISPLLAHLGEIVSSLCATALVSPSFFRLFPRNLFSQPESSDGVGDEDAPVPDAFWSEDEKKGARGHRAGGGGDEADW